MSDKVDLNNSGKKKKEKTLVNYRDINSTEKLNKLLEEFSEVFVRNPSGNPFKITRAELS